MSERAPYPASTDESVPTGEPVWSIWMAMMFFVIWISLQFVIQIATALIAAFLTAPGPYDEAGLQKHLEDFALTMEHSPYLGVGVVACVLLTWMIVLGLIDMQFGNYPKVARYRAVGLKAPERRFALPLAVFAGAVTCLAGQGVAMLLQAEDAKSTGFEEMMTSTAGRISVTFLALFLAPFAEEIFFRGFLFPPMARLAGPVNAVFLNACVFTLPHLGSYGFSPAYLVPVLMLGLVVAGLRAWSGSVLPGMAAHFAFNGTSLLLYAFEQLYSQSE